MIKGEKIVDEASELQGNISQTKQQKIPSQFSPHKQTKVNESVYLSNINTNNLKSFEIETFIPENFCSSVIRDINREMMNSAIRGKSSSEANSEENDMNYDPSRHFSGDENEFDLSYGAVNSGDESLRENEEFDERNNDVINHVNNQMTSEKNSGKKKLREGNNTVSSVRSPQLQFDTMNPLGLEIKRQKRKHLPHQQQDFTSYLTPYACSNVERTALHHHILQLQEQLKAVKNSFTEITQNCHHNIVANTKDGSQKKNNGSNTRNVEGFFPLLPYEGGIDALPAVRRFSGPATLSESHGSITCSTSPPLMDANVKHEQLTSSKISAKTSFRHVGEILKSRIMHAVDKTIDSVLENHFANPQEPQCSKSAFFKNDNPFEKEEATYNDDLKQVIHQIPNKEPNQKHDGKNDLIIQNTCHQNLKSDFGEQFGNRMFFVGLNSKNHFHPSNDHTTQMETSSDVKTDSTSAIVYPYPNHMNFLEKFSTSSFLKSPPTVDNLSAFSSFRNTNRSIGEADLLRHPTGRAASAAAAAAVALGFPSSYPYNCLQSNEMISGFPVEPEQTEALPLLVTGNGSCPKKKRTKVTDTRLSPRAKSALLGDISGGAACFSSINGFPSGMTEMNSSMVLPSCNTGGIEHMPTFLSPFNHSFIPPHLSSIQSSSKVIASPSFHRSDLFNFRFHDGLFDCNSPIVRGNAETSQHASGRNCLSPTSPTSSLQGLRMKPDALDSTDLMDSTRGQKISFLYRFINDWLAWGYLRYFWLVHS